MHEILVNRLGGLSLPRKSVVRLTDRPDMTLDVYRGRKTTRQQTIQQQIKVYGYTFRQSNFVIYLLLPFSMEVKSKRKEFAPRGAGHENVLYIFMNTHIHENNVCTFTLEYVIYAFNS